MEITVRFVGFWGNGSGQVQFMDKKIYNKIQIYNSRCPLPIIIITIMIIIIIIIIIMYL